MRESFIPKTESLDAQRRRVVDFLDAKARDLTNGATADKKTIGSLIGLTRAILRLRHGYGDDERVQAVLTKHLRNAPAEISVAASAVLNADRAARIGTAEDDEITRYDPNVELRARDVLMGELQRELAPLLEAKADAVKKVRGPAASGVSHEPRDRTDNPPDLFLIGVAAMARRGDPVTKYTTHAREILEDIGGPGTAQAIALLEELTELETEQRRDRESMEG